MKSTVVEVRVSELLMITMVQFLLRHNKRKEMAVSKVPSENGKVAECQSAAAYFFEKLFYC